MKSFKIAIAMPIFPNLVQTYIISQLAAFKTKNVDFIVIAERKKTYKTLPSIITDNNLLDEVIYINARFSNLFKELLSLPYFSGTFWRNAIKILQHRDNNYSPSRRLKAILRSRAAVNSFNIMHTDSFYISYNYLFLKDVFHIPIASTYHGQVPRGVKKLSAHKLSEVLNKVDVFTVNTDFAKNELIDLGGPSEKIHIIPQGTNLSDFSFIRRSINPSEPIKLLTVARLSIEKGHHIAIEALHELTKEFPLLEYHIVGHGPEKAKLKTLTKKYNLQDKVIFHGFKTGDELKHLFNTSHIFILPSIDTKDGYLVETQGVVLQEAQSSGLPVIGSRAGGIPDVITDKVTGLLFNDGDKMGLAQSIKKLITDHDFYQNLVTSGRQDVENRFDVNIVSQKMIDLFRSVLNRV